MLEKLCTPALGTQMKEWERSISATGKKKKKKPVESAQVLYNSIIIKTLLALSYSEVLCSREASELQVICQNKVEL